MPTTTSIAYPLTRRIPRVDEYHGVAVADPYQWLETTDSAATCVWIAEQNKYSRNFLDSLPYREAIAEQFRAQSDYYPVSDVQRRGRRYFWTRQDGSRHETVICTASNPQTKNPRVILDPANLPDGGRLSGLSISPDGKLLAYAQSGFHSEWQEWFVRDVKTGKDLAERLQWCQVADLSWTDDSRGFFYNRYPSGSTYGACVNLSIYYHKIGTSQDDDTLIYHNPDEPTLLHRADLSTDGRYLTIYAFFGGTFRVLIKDLQAPKEGAKLVFDHSGCYWRVIDNDGPLFWVYTNYGAPNFRVLSFDVREASEAGVPALTQVVAESSERLERVSMLDNKFVLSYTRDACTVLEVRDRRGQFIHNANLPGRGTVYFFKGRRTERIAPFTFHGFSDPGSAYLYDMRADWSYPLIAATDRIQPGGYTTHVTSRQGAGGKTNRVLVCYKRNALRLNGNPTLMISAGTRVSPWFSLDILLWLDMGGVCAVPLLQEATAAELIAAGEFLIERGYTAAGQLAITGNTRDATLVGECLNLRPELFAAVLPANGFMDLLRFQLFSPGDRLVGELGNISHPEDFTRLFARSPLHNLRPIDYPPTLISTAYDDPTVAPASSYKFGAALQAVNQSANPILLCIDDKTGLFDQLPLSRQVADCADLLSFLIDAVGFVPEGLSK